MQLNISFESLGFYAMEEVGVPILSHYKEVKNALIRMIKDPNMLQDYQSVPEDIIDKFTNVCNRYYSPEGSANIQAQVLKESIINNNLEIIKKIDGVQSVSKSDFDVIKCRVEGYQQVELIKKSIDYKGSFEIRVIDYVEQQ